MKRISTKGLLLFFLFSFLSISSFAQVWSDSLKNYFAPTSSQVLDFDEFIIPTSDSKEQLPIQSIAVEQNTTIYVHFVVNQVNKRNFTRWNFISDNGELVPVSQINDSLYSIRITSENSPLSIIANYRNKDICGLNIIPLEKKEEHIIIVPLVNQKINIGAIQNELNKIYGKANISFTVSLKPVFKSEQFNSETVFANPILEHKRYTQQMRDLRNTYFKTNKTADKKSYYVFVIPEFVDSTLQAYMPTNKAIAFIKTSKSKTFSYDLARELGFGLGSFIPLSMENPSLVGTTTNIMDTTKGSSLSNSQWQTLQQSAHSFQFYDEDEDVRTNNGLVAYYFWHEDENGYITMDGKNPLSGIHRPYKKNYRSFHLNIEDYFFKELFRIGSYRISAWHFIIFLVTGLIWYFARRYVLRKIVIQQKIKRYWRRPVKIVSILVLVFIYYGIFTWLNNQFTHYEVRSGKIKDFSTYTYAQVRKSILYDNELKHENESALSSQLIIKRKNDWYVKERKNVLYFTAKEDSNGVMNKVKYSHDSDSLNIFQLNFYSLAESHYIVYNYYDEQGNFKRQRVFNHVGFDITDKLTVDDDSKRILLFVNGYRPTSIGKTFEDNFKDIRKHGLEYPDSKNLIYDFDRYDYWHPWREIDILFQQRINATNTYYADGHHSVSTSNHESLIKFTSNSNAYPERCKNLNKHTCYTTKVPVSSFLSGAQSKDTYSLLATTPNKSGFNYRRNQGKIAGKNLLMMLNEFPSRAENDTLYVVAHSMGYAYALGMLDELRGKINLGSFYIIAPENGESGKVNLKEWIDIWQYGSNLYAKYPDAPCLQDGVAPQSKVGGLNSSKIVFIPKKFDNIKGYFDSHFIGYYTWVFDIPKNEKGYIRQQ